MGGNLSLQEADIAYVLETFERELKKWTGNIKNLKETWETNEREARTWVPVYLRTLMEETETDWVKIKSVMLPKKGDGKKQYPTSATNFASCCREKEAEIKQLQKNNETLLQNKQKTETELKKLKESTAEYQKVLQMLASKDEKGLSGQSMKKNGNSTTSDNLDFEQRQTRADDALSLPQNAVLKKLIDIEEKSNAEKAELKTEKERLTAEIGHLKELVKLLENEKSELLAKHEKESDKLATHTEECEEQQNKENPQIQSSVTTADAERIKNDHQIEMLRKKCLQIENDKLKLSAEKDELLLRLSKFAGDKLTENNPAITDLSDPNRPTKLGEMYSEIYDNEWTNAFEALVEGGYDEITAIETLRLTLQNVIKFCESKADRLLQRASDSVNLLFEEYQKMKMISPSTMPNQQAQEVELFLRREKSTLDDLKLWHRWKPKSKNSPRRAEISTEKMQTKEHETLDAENKLKQLRKDMATAMVPVVQKAYMAASWTNECIEDLKPYILKCLYLGWMMAVQSPPLVLHSFPRGKEIKFDKNFYKEYTASGPLVSYVVWPALLLNENGPVVCKGVAEGKKS